MGFQGPWPEANPKGQGLTLSPRVSVPDISVALIPRMASGDALHPKAPELGGRASGEWAIPQSVLGGCGQDHVPDPPGSTQAAGLPGGPGCQPFQGERPGNWPLRSGGMEHTL